MQDVNSYGLRWLRKLRDVADPCNYKWSMSGFLSCHNMECTNLTACKCADILFVGLNKRLVCFWYEKELGGCFGPGFNAIGIMPMLEASAPTEARCAAPTIVRYLIARLFQLARFSTFHSVFHC